MSRRTVFAFALCALLTVGCTAAAGDSGSSGGHGGPGAGGKADNGGSPDPASASGTCLFGSTLSAFEASGPLVRWEQEPLNAAGVPSLSDADAAALVDALHVSSHTEVTTPTEALGVVDGGKVEQDGYLDDTTQDNYYAFIYTLSGHSYGAFFYEYHDVSGVQIAAVIKDDQISDCHALAPAGDPGEGLEPDAAWISDVKRAYEDNGLSGATPVTRDDLDYWPTSIYDHENRIDGRGKTPAAFQLLVDARTVYAVSDPNLDQKPVDFFDANDTLIAEGTLIDGVDFNWNQLVDPAWFDKVRQTFLTTLGDSGLDTFTAVRRVDLPHRAQNAWDAFVRQGLGDYSPSAYETTVDNKNVFIVDYEDDGGIYDDLFAADGTPFGEGGASESGDFSWFY